VVAVKEVLMEILLEKTDRQILAVAVEAVCIQLA
jgi:hypothetical protein